MAGKSNAGAPTKYDPKYCEAVIEYGKQGLSKAQMAARLEVHRETLNNWADNHPEFFDAIKKATDLAQDLWEQRFVKGALGEDEGQQMNPTMMIFLMKNRFPADWCEKQTTEHEVSGAKKVVVEWGE
jgi:transposase